MYIDRNVLEEYPFKGQFYTAADNMPEDGDMLADLDSPTPDENGESVDEDDITVVLETECDIQDTNKVFSNSTSGSYLDIYFPFDVEKGITVRIGQRFRSDNWYRSVDGRVYNVVPSPMGGCVARIREIGVDNDKTE